MSQEQKVAPNSVGRLRQRIQFVRAPGWSEALHRAPNLSEAAGIGQQYIDVRRIEREGSFNPLEGIPEPHGADENG